MRVLWNALSYLFKFWLRWVFAAALGLSSVAMSRGCSRVAVHRRLLTVASRVAEQGLQARGLQWLQCAGLVALRPTESSQIRGQTCVPGIGRWILNHWTIREVPPLLPLCNPVTFSTTNEHNYSCDPSI